jgi:hypothetical protein
MTPALDWERIHLEYRLGVFSTRELGRRHQVPEATIRKRAAAWGWKKDLLPLALEVAHHIRRGDSGPNSDASKVLQRLFGIGFP